MKEKKRILNDEIKSNYVFLVNDDWENFWEMSLNDAKDKARELWFDLMEVWKKDNKSIVKILDYWKFLYKQKKNEQKSKQKWKAPDLKTIRITFQIWEHDIEIKRKQAQKFAELWHPLKVTLMLRWRENKYWDLAYIKFENFIKSIEDIYKLEWSINKMWNNFNAMLKLKK